MRMVQLPTQSYQVPRGMVGRRFLTILVDEFRGVRERKWNSERPLVFAIVILQKKPGVRRAKDIRARLTSRMNLWDQHRYKALVDDTELEVLQKTSVDRPPDEETQARSYNARVLSGRINSAVRGLTNREAGGVKQPDDLCSKAGRPVWQVLEEKHPDLREPPSVETEDGAFEPYPAAPTPIQVEVSAEDVEKIASRLSGAAGPGGTDAVDLQNWLLRFGRESEALRLEMAEWTNWLANSHPPWAAYRAIMANRLVALDKMPGTRPVGIGETYRRLWAKCLLKSIGSQATAACGNHNLCAGLPAGIEGAVHAVRAVWDDPTLIPTEQVPPIPNATATDGDDPMTQQPPPAAVRPPAPDPPGTTSPDTPPPAAQSALGDPDLEDFITSVQDEVGLTRAEVEACLLVDARNGFNELGRKAMLWTVRHLWGNGSRFSFNCYRHSSILILRRRNGKDCVIILSKEGVTQGDPLSMVLYGLSLTPLSKSLRRRFPDIVIPWYADDGAMIGKTGRVREAFLSLCELGPGRGYFPEPDKSILASKDCDHPSATAIVDEFKFKHVDGHRYLGGFIGSAPARAKWIEPQIQKWVRGIEKLAMVARKYPQTAYAGLARSLQSEWQYLQRVTPDIAEDFTPIELAIATTFLPALFDTTAAEIAKLRDLLALPVRLGGLGIPNPTKIADHCYESSTTSTESLSRSLIEGGLFGPSTFREVAGAARRSCKKAYTDEQTVQATALQTAAGPAAARRMKRSCVTGAWLTVMPLTLNGTDLSVDEFRDCLRMRFGLVPTSLPHRCEGCGQRFTPEHAMSCKKGGFVLLRHNDVAAEFGQLCEVAFTKSAVSDEPLIQNSRDVQIAGANRTEPVPAIRGDVGVFNFWRRGTQAIFDIRVTDTDNATNRNREPAAVLRSHEMEKKGKYNDACQARRKHFTPLVFSVDGMQGTEAKAASQRLASCLAKKWKRSYSELCGYVRSRISMALARSLSRCLRADRASIVRAPHAPWDSGVGLGLYR